MAVKYPIISGNWSNPLIWNGGTLPTAADDVYSNNQTVTVDVNPTVLSIRNSPTTGVTAGGGFVLTNGVTLSATSAGFVGYNTSILVDFALNSPSSATILGNITPPSFVDSTPTVRHTGTGTLNVVGNSFAISRSGASSILVSGLGTLNFTGTLFSSTSVASTSVGIRITGNCTVNVTGDLIWQCVLTGASNSPLILINSAAILNVIGTVYGGSSNGINSSGASRIVVTGALIAGVAVGQILGSSALVSTNNTSQINILTGPFVCHSSGIFPINVYRMNYYRTIGSYFEFRDETTNGALPPAAPAPATRLVSPDTVVDAPVQSDVREGVIYALGTFTGTLAVPAPGSVALGVATDDTVGTAVLTPAAVWDYATASITDVNSIGARVKNTSTVETTGEQLEAFLNG